MVQVQGDFAEMVACEMGRASVHQQILRLFKSSPADVALKRTFVNTKITRRLMFVSECTTVLVVLETFLRFVLLHVDNFVCLRFLIFLRNSCLLSVCQYLLRQFRITFFYLRYHGVLNWFWLYDLISTKTALTESERVDQIPQTVAANVFRRLVVFRNLRAE